MLVTSYPVGETAARSRFLHFFLLQPITRTQKMSD